MYLRFLIIIRYEMKGKCFLFTFALLLAGCTASYDHKGKMPVVQVGKDFLYREDLEAVMPVNLGRRTVRVLQKSISKTGWKMRCCMTRPRGTYRTTTV